MNEVPRRAGFKEFVKKIPVVRAVARIVYSLASSARFSGSGDYWRRRYASGRDSGAGSYGELARFKADVINDFVRRNDVQSVIEFGCGDGSQLRLADYQSYLGFDISSDAISICETLFRADETKAFRLIDDYDDDHAELALSLDVIYHLVEDDVFDKYMSRLFRSADRFVIIYSSNTDENPRMQSSHVRHRNFSKWVERNTKNWTLQEHVPNRLPYRGDFEDGSFADFWIYGRDVELAPR